MQRRLNIDLRLCIRLQQYTDDICLEQIQSVHPEGKYRIGVVCVTVCSTKTTIINKFKTNSFQTLSFYRVTLCINVVFAVVRCPSVSPSICHICALYPDGCRYRQTFFLAR